MKRVFDERTNLGRQRQFWWGNEMRAGDGVLLLG